ncbi:MAG: hypothetical protein RMY62_004460 [Nostoc sp. ZfuVER08]|nr:hypothetical protein [Nostoc sp. ZfuVER08]
MNRQQSTVNDLVGVLPDPSLLLLASHQLSQDRQRIVSIKGILLVLSLVVVQLRMQSIPTNHNGATLPKRVLSQGFFRQVAVLYFPRGLLLKHLCYGDSSILDVWLMKGRSLHLTNIQRFL